MLSEAIREAYLCDELQRPKQLNQSLSRGERNQFNLLLSALCQDVSVQPQFGFSKEQATAISARGSLRQQFELTAKAPISANADSANYAEQLRVLLQTQGNTALQLALSMRPEALNIRNNPAYIEPEVLQQLDLVEQQRYAEQHPQKPVEPAPVTMLQVLSDFDYDKEIKLTHYR